MKQKFRVLSFVMEIIVKSEKENKNLHLKYSKATFSVIDEILRARKTYSSFHSSHEGYAIIKEELDELWDEIKAKNELRDIEKMKQEAKQIAAMAIAFMVDVCEDEEVARR